MPTLRTDLRHLALALLPAALCLSAFAQDARKPQPPAAAPVEPVAEARPATPAPPELIRSQSTLPPFQTVAAGQRPEPAEKDGSLHQGLTVHGHWIIDIKNPDGTLTDHRDFENTLQYDGAQQLVGLLSGAASQGGWEIYFNAQTNGTTPCTSGQFPFCAIVQSTTYEPGLFACSVYYCVGGLTVTPTFGNSASLKLAGNLTAPGAGSIGNVYTGNYACGAQSASVTNISPAACMTATTSSPYSGTFSGTAITPVNVVAGQIIQISVTFTFS